MKMLNIRDYLEGGHKEGNHLYVIKYVDNYNHNLMQDLIFAKDVFEALESFKVEYSNIDYSIIEVSFYQW